MSANAALQVGTGNQEFGNEKNGVKTESVQCFRDLGVTIVLDLKFSHLCKDAVGKASRMLGFITRNYPLRIKT